MGRVTAATRWPDARATRGMDLMGHAHVIRVDVEGFTGGSDPRADGAALGL